MWRPWLASVLVSAALPLLAVSAQAGRWGKEYVPNVPVVTQDGKTLNFYDGRRYVERQYPKPMELVALHGSIAADASIHLHAALASKDTRMVGGHLSTGAVHNFIELCVLRLDQIKVRRKTNPDTKLSEFSIGMGRENR